MPTDLKTKLESLLQQRSMEEEELLGQLQQLCDESALAFSKKQQTLPLGTFLQNQLSKLENVEQHYMRTEFEDLNSVMGGFTAGELVVLGARPAMGKTQLLVNLAVQLSAKQPVLYCSYDLSESALAVRIMSVLSGMDGKKIRSQQLQEHEQAELNRAQENGNKLQLHCYGGLNNGIDALRLLCKQHIAEHGTKVIIVDYLQLLSSNKPRQYREAEVSYISRMLKKIAREEQVCVIAASQLSRSVETRGGDKIPQLADLRDSGSIEQDADIVFFLYRPEYYGLEMEYFGDNAANTHLIIAKNRNGKTGTVELRHDQAFARFHSIQNNDPAFKIAMDRLSGLGFEPIPGSESPF
jgi:replicative DNA helicase